MSQLQTMTEGERNLIAAYRVAGARGKRSIMRLAESMTKDWPALRTQMPFVPNCGPEATAKRSRATGSADARQDAPQA